MFSFPFSPGRQKTRLDLTRKKVKKVKKWNKVNVHTFHDKMRLLTFDRRAGKFMVSVLYNYSVGINFDFLSTLVSSQMPPNLTFFLRSLPDISFASASAAFLGEIALGQIGGAKRKEGNRFFC